LAERRQKPFIQLRAAGRAHPRKLEGRSAQHYDEECEKDKTERDREEMRGVSVSDERTLMEEFIQETEPSAESRRTGWG